MIEMAEGSLFEASAEALVNAVNCVGVMGKGLALQFRNAFPDNYEAYKAACDRNDVQPGKVFVFDLNRVQNPRMIFNFPTKRHWKEKSWLKDIEVGLSDLVRAVRDHHVKSVAVPALGCGLGGLNWDEIRPMIEGAFVDLPDVRVFLFPPTGLRKGQERVSSEVPLLK